MTVKVKSPTPHPPNCLCWIKSIDLENYIIFEIVFIFESWKNKEKF